VGQNDWNWMPSHYVWTPRGYVYVNGYYDYSVARRGVLFAPVYFNSGIYSQPGFSYSPAMAISPAIFGSHLFLRPTYGHYYYGDYYGSNYATAGFSPGFSFNSGRQGYDPFYAQQRWVNRQDPAWAQSIQSNFQNLRAHDNLRPPRTWADQHTRLASGGNVNLQNVAIATSLDDLAKSKDHSLRFQAVDLAERQQLAQHSQAVAQHRDQRQKLEVQAANPLAVTPKTPGDLQPVKFRFPPSPIAAASADRLGHEHTPPQRHEVLKPDLTVTPTPRSATGNPKSIPGEQGSVNGAADNQRPRHVSPQEAKHESNAPAAAKSNAPPQRGPPVKAPAEAKGPPPEKSNINSPGAPQGKPQGEAKNKSK
jgi:hypothetical protein